jgi:hypothetical protein
MAPPAFKSPRNSARAASVRRLHPNGSPRDEERVNASSAALSAIILLCAIATQHHEKRPVVVHIEVKDTGARCGGARLRPLVDPGLAQSTAVTVIEVASSPPYTRGLT